MSPVPASADRLCSARHRGSVASVEGGNRPLGGKAFTSVQCLVASAGDDLFSYAAAAAAVAVANSSGGEDGGPNQRLNMSDSTPPACSHSDHLMVASAIPVSLQFGQLLAGLRTGNPLHQYDHPPPWVSPGQVAPELDAKTQILNDLRTLATWPRLRIATLPDPIVGGLDPDPTGVSDRLGVKGMSVYTSFVERETFQCRVCGVRSSGTALALLHQRHRRHFQQFENSSMP